jgi:hypothetical protein
MHPWKAVLRISPIETQLLVTNPQGDDVLKARLPTQAQHPRALLSLLEAMALWSGAPLSAAAYVAHRCPMQCVSALLGDVVVPTRSALVYIDWDDDVRRKPRRLAGLGDFQALRRLQSQAAGAL